MPTKPKKKSSKQRNSKVLWGIGINLAGMWGPYRMTQDEFSPDEKPLWYDESGNYEVEGPGIIEQEGFVSYADPDKKKVELFQLGVTTLAKQMGYFIAGVRNISATGK
jgi:hypothetical protein